VTTSAQDSDQQPDFALLIDADLPDGWWFPERSPLDTEGESAGIDRSLHYEDWIDNAPGLDRKLRSEHSNLDAGRWFLIQHTESGTRVLLRLQQQVRVYENRMGEVRITGIVHMPFFAGDPITSQLLRELPTAKIEAAINKRLFAVTGATRFQNGKITLPSGRTLRGQDLVRPLGDPKRTPRTATRTRPRESRASATSPSPQPRVGSPKPEPADCSHLAAEGERDSARGS